MIHVTNLKRTPDGGLEIGEFYIYEDCYPSEAAFEEAVINEKASDFTISEKAQNEQETIKDEWEKGSRMHKTSQSLF